MKCKNCEAELTPQANMVISECPFCGASILPEQESNSLENTLSVIYQQIGDVGMRNGQLLVSWFKDLAPGASKRS